MRIVSISPSNTEIVAYLNQTHLLVGVDNYSDYPVEVKKLPKLGPDLSIDMDKVASLKPDLVLASLSVPGMEKNIEALEDRGLPYIILKADSLYEIGEEIRKVGTALGVKREGEAKASAFLAEIDSYRQKNRESGVRPSLYWEWWPKPVFSPGGKNWLTEISELAGAVNIFADKDIANYKTDWEEVKRRDPDHICMVWVGVAEDKMNPDLLKKRPGWNGLKALKYERIHVLEESLFCRPGPRLLAGLRQLDTLLNEKRDG
ncbi:cobalamin-binding protein [Halobacillus sp. ACCC02827]|uniref:cobalamin-binding protein n=1 Tax=unclassified Halobacillus TaxID=2636472 RepID=UPI00078133DC|nr:MULTISPECIES: cobalamin-binding protein [unclassified Halobacillus]WJE16748.1 cobalamin-binding protein [Halobacillus sp. ACCC02827]